MTKYLFFVGDLPSYHTVSKVTGRHPAIQLEIFSLVLKLYMLISNYLYI